MRPWKSVIDPSVGHLVLDGNNTDRSEVQVIFVTRYFVLPGHLRCHIYQYKLTFSNPWAHWRIFPCHHTSSLEINYLLLCDVITLVVSTSSRTPNLLYLSYSRKLLNWNFYTKSAFNILPTCTMLVKSDLCFPSLLKMCSSFHSINKLHCIGNCAFLSVKYLFSEPPEPWDHWSLSTLTWLLTCCFFIPDVCFLIYLTDLGAPQ
jgi:hypothetical protein